MKQYISNVDTILNTIFGKIKLTKDTIVEPNIAEKILPYVREIEVSDSIVNFIENGIVNETNEDNNLECIIKDTFDKTTKGKK